MREIDLKTRADHRIIVYFLAIAICVFLGPFSTSAEMSFWDRVVFWVVGILSVGFFMEVCIHSSLRSPLLSKLNAWFRLIIGTGIGAVPGTATIIFLNKVFRPDINAAEDFPSLWIKVFGTGMLIAGMDLLLRSVTQPKTQDAEAGQPMPGAHPGQTAPYTNGTLAAKTAGETPPQAAPKTDVVLSLPRLASRLPEELRLSPILSLSMQDHYVEVSTEAGRELLLMRLSDAIDLLDGLPGSQTHRSHWVSAAAASKLEKDGRKRTLLLSDGRSLPVSGSYVDDVKTLLKEKGPT